MSFWAHRLCHTVSRKCLLLHPMLHVRGFWTTPWSWGRIKNTNWNAYREGKSDENGYALKCKSSEFMHNYRYRKERCLNIELWQTTMKFRTSPSAAMSLVNANVVRAVYNRSYDTKTPIATPLQHCERRRSSIFSTVDCVLGYDGVRYWTFVQECVWSKSWDANFFGAMKKIFFAQETHIRRKRFGISNDGEGRWIKKWLPILLCFNGSAERVN